MTAPAPLENPYAGQGSVLLDVGDDIGALVVAMPAAMEGVEVEIRPRGAHPHHHLTHHHHDHRSPHSHHPHVAVVSRPVQGGVVPSLVYPDLVEGVYELYLKDTDHLELVAAVAGGSVTEVSWPS